MRPIYWISLSFLFLLSYEINCANPLKILFVLHEFPKFNQPFILNQITGLIDRGHDIHIYANHQRHSIIPQEIKKYNLLAKVHYGQLPAGLNSFDIIYCHFGIDGYVGLELKHRYGLTGKIVTCFRGDDITEYLRRHPKGLRYRYRGLFKIPCYFPGMYNELFEKGDFFLPVCEYFSKILIRHGCDAQKIVVHHSAINFDEYTFNKRQVDVNEPIRIISCGRLVELKGTEFLIRAFALLSKKYRNRRKLELVIVGDGPQKKYLQNLAKKLLAKNSVIFMGWQPHEEIKRILCSCHIFALPSITTSSGTTEGIPNAAMEACATGMPVVLTKHGGNSELVVDGVSGLLVEERNVKDLFIKLDFLVQHPKIWKTMGKAGAEQIKKYHNITVENDKLEKIFYSLISGDSNAFIKAYQ